MPLRIYSRNQNFTYLTCNLPGAVIYSDSGDLLVTSNLTDVRSPTGTPDHLPQVCDTPEQLFQ